MEDWKRKNIESYEMHARAQADRYEKFGARKEYINRVFSYCTKENPFVFEIGCGPGVDAQEIMKKTKHYAGMDISHNMIDIAREKNPDGVFLYGDIEDYDLPSDVDIFVALTSLLHVPRESMAKILNQCHDKLNHDGLIYLSLKTSNAYHGRVNKNEYGERTYFFYDEDDIVELVQDKYKVLSSELHVADKSELLEIVLQKNS